MAGRFSKLAPPAAAAEREALHDVRDHARRREHDLSDPFRFLQETNIANQFLFTGIAGSILLFGGTNPAACIAFVTLSFGAMLVANYRYAPALGRGLLANNLRTVGFAAGAWTGRRGSSRWPCLRASTATFISTSFTD